MVWGFPAAFRGGGRPLVNARSETVGEKAIFRRLLQQGRCLVPASGFYEWRRSQREPWYFAPKDGGLLTLAALWRPAPAMEHRSLPRLVILTRPALTPVDRIHSRMPLLVAESDRPTWLDPGLDAQELLRLLAASGPELQGIPVSREINRSTVDHPGLIEPLPGVTGDLFDSI